VLRAEELARVRLGIIVQTWILILDEKSDDYSDETRGILVKVHEKLMYCLIGYVKMVQTWLDPKIEVGGANLSMIKEF
jgi:hypothetical protein